MNYCGKTMLLLTYTVYVYCIYEKYCAHDKVNIKTILQACSWNQKNLKTVLDLRYLF